MRFYFSTWKVIEVGFGLTVQSLTKLTPLIVLFCFSTLHSQTPAPKVVNLIRGGDMEAVSVESNGWDGVSGGALKVFSGRGLVVDSRGQVQPSAFPASIQVADMNNDGLKDLVVADSADYFWIFLNKGTPKEPKFTRGELLPLWITNMKIPKIQMVDFNGDGALDIVFGDYLGRLYFIPNSGTATMPKFVAPEDPKELLVKTDPTGRLWCNYLAPFYFDWTGDGLMDLILGEGTFSANSIFLLPNTGTNSRPVFETRRVMLLSQGREHLVPQILDWNHDGKPDLIFGERDKGQISFCLNKGELPFDSSTVISVGTSGATTTLANPCFADLNNDGLPDLVISSPTGNIRIALNTGTKDSYKFTKSESIKGEAVLPSVLRCVNWVSENPGGIEAPEGARFFLLKAMSKRDRYKNQKNLEGYDPELDLPIGTAGQSCLFYDAVDPKQEFIKDTPRFVHAIKNKTFTLKYSDAIYLKPDVEYEFSFFVKGSGFSDADVQLTGAIGTELVEKGNVARFNTEYANLIPQSDFTIPSSWTQVKRKIKYSKTKGDKKESEDFRLHFVFKGEGSFYLDDVMMVEKGK